MATTKSETTTAEVKTASPVVEAGAVVSSESGALSTTEQEDLVADKDEDDVRGSVYYILLDEYGSPTGTVLEKVPEAGIPYITAYGVNQSKPTVLSTPSGAPLTKTMNPEHSNRDPAFEARNPRPEKKVVAIGDKVTTKNRKTTVEKSAA